MLTTQQKVAALNTTFGNPAGDVASPNIKALRKQAELVLEEAIELYAATHPHLDISVQKHVKPDEGNNSTDTVDMYETLDALGDLLTVVYGAGHIAGVDSDAVYDLVHTSNMSKLLANEAEADAALEVYFADGVPEDALGIEGTYPEAFIRVLKDCTDGDGKFYPAGKFLKNLPKFQLPNFTPLLEAE